MQGGDYDLANASGRMTARIIGAVARHESEHKSERIRRKQLELAEAGKLSGGGRRPYGYQTDRMTVVEAEAAVIRDPRRSGARRGAAAGPGRRPQRAQDLLRCRARRGRRRQCNACCAHRGSPDSVPTTANPLPRRCGRRSSTPTPPPSSGWYCRTPCRRGGGRPAEYLLTGPARCVACQAKMHGWASSRGVARYRCPPRWSRGGCGRVGIDARHIEHDLVDAVLHVLDAPALQTARGAGRLPGRRRRPQGDGVVRAAGSAGRGLCRGAHHPGAFVAANARLATDLDEARALAAPLDGLAPDPLASRMACDAGPGATSTGSTCTVAARSWPP